MLLCASPLGWASGCGSGHDEAPREPDTTSGSEAPSSSIVSSADAVDTDASAIQRPPPAPREVVCRVVSSSSALGALPLRARPASPPFATLAGDGGRPGSKIELGVFQGPQDALSIDHRGAAVHLRAFVEEAAVDLALAKPVVVGGFLTPRSVRIVRASKAGLDVEPKLGGEIEPVRGGLARHVTCADLTVRTALDPKTLPSSARAGSKASWVGDEPVQLSTEPETPVVARLHPKAGSPLLVVGRREAKRLVAWDTGDAVVVGWVDAARVGGAVDGESARRAPPAPSSRKASSKVSTCAAEVALFVTEGGEHVRVGEVAARTPLHSLGSEGAFTRIDAPVAATKGGPPEVALVEGAALLVETSTLSGCDTKSE